MHVRTEFQCNFYSNNEFGIWRCESKSAGACLRTSSISYWTIHLWFRGLTVRRAGGLLGLLLRLLCSLPEAVWPCFVCDGKIISQLHKDPEAEGVDPSEEPVLHTQTNTHAHACTHTHRDTHTHTRCIAWRHGLLNHSQEWGLSG